MNRVETPIMFLPFLKLLGILPDSLIEVSTEIEKWFIWQHTNSKETAKNLNKMLKMAKEIFLKSIPTSEITEEIQEIATLLVSGDIQKLKKEELLKYLTENSSITGLLIKAIVKAHYKHNTKEEIGEEELEQTVNKILPRIKKMVEEIKEYFSNKGTEEEIVEALMSKINPIGTTLDVVRGIFKEGKKILMVEEGVKTPKDTGDIRVLRYRIEKEANDTLRYGTIIGTKMMGEREIIVRAKIAEDGTVIIYSKQGLEGVGEEEIEEMFIEANTSGIKEGMIKEGVVLAFAGEGDIKGRNITKEDMEKRIEITRKNGITKSDTQIKFDLRENSKINEEVCKGEEASTGANTFIITDKQAKDNKKIIKELRKKGYRFIVEYKAKTEKDIPGEIEYDGIQINAIEIKDIKTVIEIMGQLKRMCNIDKSISIELSEKEKEEFKGKDIFNEYGILPIVKAVDVEKIAGKKEVTEITKETKEKILKDEEVVGLIADDDSKSIFSEIKDKIKEKISGYEKGLNAGLKEGQRCDILKIKEILIGKEEISKQDLKELGLTASDEVYIKYLLEKEKDEEAKGYVVGIALKEMENKLMKVYGETIDKEKFSKEGEKYERGILTLMLSMEISGMNIEELLKESKEDLGKERGWNVSAEEMYRIIGERGYEIITRVLKENDKRIKELRKEEIATAKEDFKELNILIQDRFRAKGINIGMEISIKAVKEILTRA